MNKLLLGSAAAMLGLAAGGCALLRANTLGGLESLPARALPTDLAASLQRDVGKLHAVHAELQKLLPAREEYLRGLCRAVEGEHRRLFQPGEEETMRGQFARCLTCRRELLELAATYGDYASAPEGGPRDRAMLLHVAAAMLSGQVEVRVAANPCQGHAHAWMVRRKLNESTPDCGFPQGAYDMICQTASGAAGKGLRAKLLVRFADFQASPRPAGGDEDLRRLQQVVADAAAECRAGAAKADAAWTDAVLDSGVEAAYAPVYAAVELTSLMIAQSHLPVRRCITPAQIEELSHRLQPGDILFRRGFGRLTNRFIPGYWTHTMIYVGVADDLARLGVKSAPSAEEGCVIETHSHGVVLTALREALEADSLLVLRPRLAQDQIAKALGRALAYRGAGFDFDFDFFTGDKLTCSELVYRAYGDLLNLRPGEKYGRALMTAEDIVHAFTNARASEDRRLDFVLLLLGDARTGQARPAGAEEIP